MSAQNVQKVLLPLLLSIAVLCLGGCQWDNHKPPQAVQGVWDLTRGDFDRNGPVDLIGEYEFYWNQNLIPDDFEVAATPRPSGFIKVPAFWNGYRMDGVELPG